MNKKGSKSGETIPERRKAQRRPVLESFSLFLVVPKKGMHRLKIYDVSERGIGFDLDMEGEAAADFPIKPGERLDVLFYLNQTLHLPLGLLVQRIDDQNKIRRVGAEFADRNSKEYKALHLFVQMLDSILDLGQNLLI